MLAILAYVCACEFDKDCEIGKQLKDCSCKKSLVDDLVVTCDEIVDKPDTTKSNPNDKTNNWFIPLNSCVSFILIVTHYRC